ncbi:hypothetical protein [Comamonas antarctica]|uniref:Uncharacterized protein n=1 Tax=Comamonas antarctica TaxID=2743470 RepID=A0A6N1X9Y1_9BURK|nr:hypothetical protein [Comamonas antarctica]QKV54675.1 hypothetical protein HUK68_18235 [Comamonas antarctica]
MAGILCALAGDIVMAMTLLQRNPLRVGPRLATSLLAVLGGNALFAMALGGFSDYGLPAIGMVSGIYLAGFAWRLSGEDIRPAALLAFAGVLGLGSYLAHVVTLGIPMPLWPSFIVG